MNGFLVSVVAPDPRSSDWSAERTICVGLRQVNFCHLAKHWTKLSEPWAEIFGFSEINLFLQYRDREYRLLEEQQESVRKALEAIALQVSAALKLPCVLLDPSSPKPAREGDRREKQLVLLPGGAYGWLFAKNGEYVLDSCYIPLHACVIPAEHRWKHLVCHLVKNNAYWNSQLKEYQPPPVGKTRFVTLSTWGFDIESPQRFWREDLVNWPDQVGPDEHPLTVTLVSPQRPRLSGHE